MRLERWLRVDSCECNFVIYGGILVCLVCRVGWAGGVFGLGLAGFAAGVV